MSSQGCQVFLLLLSSLFQCLFLSLFFSLSLSFTFINLLSITLFIFKNNFIFVSDLFYFLLVFIFLSNSCSVSTWHSWLVGQNHLKIHRLFTKLTPDQPLKDRGYLKNIFFYPPSLLSPSYLLIPFYSLIAKPDPNQYHRWRIRIPEIPQRSDPDAYIYICNIYIYYIYVTVNTRLNMYCLLSEHTSEVDLLTQVFL